VEHPVAPDETDLVNRVREGDESACTLLVATYRSRMLAVAGRMLRCEEDCADAVQDALISAFQSLDQFKGHCRLSTWLHRIVVNACLMKLRAQSSRKSISIEDLSPAANATAGCSSCSSPCVHDSSAVLADREVQARVRACIDQLPKSYRDVLLLRDIHEYDTEQTSELLGASRSNVKTRLHRARQALRPLLEPIYRDAYEPGRAA
jgi:RNA polymerase sigma-70 factor (ECF subfamily)